MKSLPFASRYIYVRDVHRFYDRETGALVTREAVRDRHLHETPRKKDGTPHSPLRYLLEQGDGANKVEGITYLPGGAPILLEDRCRKVNTWQKPTLEPHPEPVGEEEVAPFLDHVMTLTDGDATAFHYLLDWFAFVVRHPGERINSSPLIVGVPGVGKNALVAPLKPILGASNLFYAGDGVLKSAFNGYMKDKQLIVVPEMMLGDRLELMNKLKPYITDSDISINEKYVPAYTIPNRTNWIFFSNHRDAARLDEDDRRYFVHISEAKRQSPAYYRRYFAWLEGDGPAKLARFLRDRDLAAFDAKAPAPMSASKQEMIRLTESNDEAYLRALFEAGAYPFDADLVVATEVVDWLTREKRIATSVHRVGRLLRKIGAEELGPRRVGKEGERPRVWCVRRHGLWREASAAKMAEHLAQMRWRRSAPGDVIV